MDIENRTDIIEEVDIFEEYRDRSRVYLDAFLSLILLPFILINFKNGELVFSFLLFLLFVQTFVNTISYIYKKIYIPHTINFLSRHYPLDSWYREYRDSRDLLGLPLIDFLPLLHAPGHN
ncbi:MAG: hypothetical protein B6D77_06210 [gamma proteobacterium symbiont of Ctena orbiculata]|nr:MAG: hypothetical protein B6D77_06210 [gamma proteobacterium symbiont of Ctena orbiculata]